MLALKLKPVIAAKAKEQQIRKPVESVLQKSAEQKPIDTRQEIAKAAGVSHDTTTYQKSEKSSLPTVNTTKEIAKAAERFRRNLLNHL